MSASIRQFFPLRRFKYVKNPYDRRVVAKLPEPYKKFYAEWQDHEEEETPIHWVPRKEKWERNPETGEIKRIQNEPIPTKYPNEHHLGLWGGEGAVEGLIKKAKYRSPVPRFWMPSLKRSVVYSEILDKYFSVVVTERALRLIDEHHGLDNYLIKTPAYDLKSLLALKLKRLLLLALHNKDFCHNDPVKQSEVIEKYKNYMLPKEELEWYGLSVAEAREKFEKMAEDLRKDVKPLKYQFRSELIEELKNQGSESEQVVEKPSWISKFNPFVKPAETGAAKEK